MELSSGWGSGTKIIVNGAIDTGLGRTYYRHPTEPGTVISWWDVGTEQQIDLLVLDAVYRMQGVAGRIGLKWVGDNVVIIDSSLPNLQSQNTNSTWYIDGTNASVQQSTAAQLTEAQLNTLWPASIIDPNTAKYNCSVWESSGLSHYPALTGARGVMTADGQKADIPNIQELMRIFCMAAIIDSLDPTVATYPSAALTGWFNNSWAWASSEYGTSHMRGVNYKGHCGSDSKTNAGVVVPVLELNLAA